MSDEDLANLGPLAVLVGEWEGDQGVDAAPSEPDRSGRRSKYRERMVFTPIGRVDNHEQVLYGLRYATTAWRLGEPNSFHEEMGYWLWDADRQQVLRCFLVPRGVSAIAGGTVAPDARRFTLEAKLGSPTYGICSNQFLDEQFKTEAFEITVEMLDDDTFRYHACTVLRIPGRQTPFNHTDDNTLRRIVAPA